MRRFKTVFLSFCATICILTACSTQGQPTPTNVPPPVAPIVFAWDAPVSNPIYTNVSYQLWIGTNSRSYFTNVATTNVTATFSNWNWGNNYVAVTASANGLTSQYSSELVYSVPLPPGSPTSFTQNP